MQVRLGHVTHTWGKCPMDQVLDEIAAIGYEGVEPFTTHVEQYYDNPDAFRALLDARNLVLSSLYYEAPFINEARIETEIEEGLKAARFLRALGGRHVMVGPGPMPKDGVSTAQYQLMAEALNRFGRYCLDMGVEICFHPHVGGTVENREQVRTIFDLTDPEVVFFVPDTGHLAKGGSDPVEVVRSYLGRVRFIHLKDMDGNRTFVELGRGKIDNRAVLEIVNQVGYTGWVLPEIPPRDMSPKDSATVSFNYLRQLLPTI